MVKPGWSSISLPSELMDGLDKFLDTNESRKIGLKSRSQIISLLIRKFLEKGTSIISDSDNSQNLTQKQLEKKIDDKFGELLHILPDLLIETLPIKAQNAEMKKLQKKNMLKNLLKSQSIPEHIKKELSKLQKE